LKTGLSYIDFTNRIHRLKKDSDVEDIFHSIQNLRNYRNKFPIFQNEIFFIIDYSQGRHILMTGNVEEIIGYHPQDFLENGLAMVIDIFQKDDFRIYNNHIYSSIYQLFKKESASQHSNYVFDFNYRMQRKDKKNISILQRSSFVTDPVTSLPLFSYGTCLDISLFKKDDTVIRKISKYDLQLSVPRMEDISTDYFYPNPEKAELTRREKELLKWVAQGLSTKQIADKFRISYNTVNNHRKNMLRKTNTKNSADLIRFAISNHYI
jgi:DNA-binding CsgD family transcriptional regulator